MTVSEIIKQVRWCIDEETCNTSDMADVIDEKDDTYMDNIIKAKINDALHWLAITAASSPYLSDSKKIGGKTSTISVTIHDAAKGIGMIELPENIELLTINRIRAKGWQKAAVPVEDTDDEALMMYDDTAMGTIDRPLATIVRENPIKLLLQPMGDEASITFVSVPKSVDVEGGSTKVDVPDKLKNSFIYYIAFLLLSAYEDTKANQMYTIALQQLGVNNQK